MSQLIIDQRTQIIQFGNQKIKQQDFEVQATCTEVKGSKGEKVKIFAKKTLHITSKIVIEAVKIAAVVAALAIFATYVTPTPFAIYAIVGAPLIEEIVFRGIIQNSIHLIQNLYNKHIRKQPATSKDIEDQRFYRIFSTSVMFGAVHLLNPYTWGARIIQATICAVIGYQLGDLMEKTHTLAWPILEHGINNAFVMSMAAHPTYVVPIMVGSFAVKLYNIYAQETDGLTIAGVIGEGICSLPQYCVKQAKNIANKIKNRQPKTQSPAAAAA